MDEGGTVRPADGEGRQGLVDERLRTPLYHQVYLVLHDKIQSGAWADGARVPSEPELAEQFGVSRITIRRALDELVGDGVIVRRRGSGTTVRFAMPSRPVLADVSNLLEHLHQMGRRTEVRLLEFDYVLPPPDEGAALACVTGELAQRSVRVRSAEGRPFSHLTTFVPEAIGRGFDADDLACMPLLSLLERQGVTIGGAEQTMTATLADPSVARALDVDVGAALLTITRVVRDRGGAGIEHITAHYRPDRYQFRMDLARVRDNGADTWRPAGKPTKTTQNREKQQ